MYRPPPPCRRKKSTFNHLKPSTVLQIRQWRLREAVSVRLGFSPLRLDGITTHRPFLAEPLASSTLHWQECLHSTSWFLFLSLEIQDSDSPFFLTSPLLDLTQICIQCDVSRKLYFPTSSFSGEGAGPAQRTGPGGGAEGQEHAPPGPPHHTPMGLECTLPLSKAWGHTALIFLHPGLCSSVFSTSSSQRQQSLPTLPPTSCCFLCDEWSHFCPIRYQISHLNNWGIYCLKADPRNGYVKSTKAPAAAHSPGSWRGGGKGRGRGLGGWLISKTALQPGTTKCDDPQIVRRGSTSSSYNVSFLEVHVNSERLNLIGCQKLVTTAKDLFWSSQRPIFLFESKWLMPVRA